jgi:hypothetical protein
MTATTETRLYSFSLSSSTVTNYLTNYLKEVTKQNTETHQNIPSLKFKGENFE